MAQQSQLHKDITRHIQTWDTKYCMHKEDGSNQYQTYSNLRRHLAYGRTVKIVNITNDALYLVLDLIKYTDETIDCDTMDIITQSFRDREKPHNYCGTYTVKDKGTRLMSCFKLPHSNKGNITSQINMNQTSSLIPMVYHVLQEYHLLHSILKFRINNDKDMSTKNDNPSINIFTLNNKIGPQSWQRIVELRIKNMTKNDYIHNEYNTIRSLCEQILKTLVKVIYLRDFQINYCIHPTIKQKDEHDTFRDVLENVHTFTKKIMDRSREHPTESERTDAGVEEREVWTLVTR